ncbi:unnamed protein product [Paramecium sonneborni]|uniref:Uncharacterized protein n=1 Tax=Paramecium sonneborni TaxID=65129 RepID=A0A8S1R5M5_9CILI|nr:unnamed protein product [Paramecium sonneborni]
MFFIGQKQTQLRLHQFNNRLFHSIRPNSDSTLLTNNLNNFTIILQNLFIILVLLNRKLNNIYLLCKKSLEIVFISIFKQILNFELERQSRQRRNDVYFQVLIESIQITQ